MKAVLINYNYRPDWLFDYPEIDYVMSDRSDSGDNWLEGFPPERIIKTKNIGNVDYDKLSYLVEFYDQLPDVFLWSKSNLFKYITKEEFDEVKDNKDFTPLLTKHHKIYADKFGSVNFYRGGIYCERNDSWYLTQEPAKFNSYPEFARTFGLKSPSYLEFAPGGNYILTRERVHRYSRDFYERLRDTLPYCKLPGEAHMLERSYYQLWS